MTQVTVREARLRHRPPMIQEVLAARAGVDQTYVSLIENLKRSPSKDIRKRLARALGVSIARLRFAESGERSSDPSDQQAVA